MHSVVFTPAGRRGTFATGTTVLDAARELGVDLDSVCGGRGICGRCQVTVGSRPGMEGRDDAYRVVQKNAMKAWETGAQLRDLLAADSRVGLSGAQLDECFDPTRFLANSGVVFDRLVALEIG